ncbi:MAG TPA: TadE family protein [Steroidobacteraceae bacterium]|nr:TadE family protein [Steroidobacteraceae bacterium]
MKTLVRLDRQAGATMVEFALVMPFALLLVLGLIQIGLMYSAKAVVNEAAFMAARAGAVQNAQVDKMTAAMQKALIPFYQDTTNSDAATRLTAALASAKADTDCASASQCFLKIEVLNPTPAAFADFGITSGASQGHTFIPNDNLEFRSHAVKGKTGGSGESIQDANALKIKVTYGYELKVPLIATLFKAVLCGTDSGVDAFGRANSPLSIQGDDDCTNFYDQGRIPIVTYATVQMQTPAWQQ